MSRDMDRIDAQLVEIKDAVGHIDEAIRGNGKPGLVLRVDRLERSRALHNKALWTAMVVSVGVAVRWVRSMWGS